MGDGRSEVERSKSGKVESNEEALKVSVRVRKGIYRVDYLCSLWCRGDNGLEWHNGEWLHSFLAGPGPELWYFIDTSPCIWLVGQ